MPFTKEKTYYFQIDALRSLMLLLGPVLHVGLSFMQFPLGEVWTHKHTETNLFFDALVLFIHVFRVPVFFVLAGFFMEMNLGSRPIKILLIKKLKRIGIPLLLGVLLLFPLVEFGLMRSNNIAFSIKDYLDFWAFAHYNTMHLWFLYYLLVFYIGHLFSTTFLQHLREQIRQLKITRLVIMVLFFIVLGVSLLEFVNSKSFDGDYSFLPQIGSVIYFFSFYVLGIVLFHSKVFFKGIQKQYKVLFVLAGISFTGLLISRSTTAVAIDFTLLENLFFVGAAYTFVLGFFGLFLKTFTKRNNVIHYISKSAYFIYVIHLPILVGLVAMSAQWQVGAFALFGFILVGTLLLSYAIYEGVRVFWRKP